MSRDTILKDEEGNLYSFDNLATQHWLEGQETGAVAAAMYLQNKAVKAFSERLDKEALILRELADLILKDVCPQLKTKAQQHKIDFPYEIPKS